MTGGATRRSAGGVTMAVYSQPLARPLPPGRVGGQQQHRGRQQPNAVTCRRRRSGIRRLRRLRPQGRYGGPQNSGAGFRRPHCFGGRVGRQASRRGVAGCPRRWGCGGDRRTYPAGSSAQGAGVPPPGEMRESGLQPLWRGEAEGWRRGGPGRGEGTTTLNVCEPARVSNTFRGLVAHRP